ncbi:MAG TPA: cupin domain-containing protein [Polyangiaceae bacterium]|nr:cupin domain-containing protein [Polyangiaceae bacterium]
MALAAPLSLGNVSRQEFLRDYWHQRPLLIRNAFASFDCPVDKAALIALARSSQVESRVVSEKGRPAFSLKRGPFSAAFFRKMPKTHWTLLVQDVDKHLPRVADLLEAFTFLPRWRIDDIMISYAVAGGSVGPHYDNYDVFLLQGQGQRRWQIGARPKKPRLLPGTELHVLENFHPEEEIVAEVGDILYLPPSIAHHGVAIGESITLSIGFRAPSQRELCFAFVEELLENASDSKRYADPKLRVQRHLGLIDAAALKQVKQLVEGGLRPAPQQLERWFARFMTEPKPHLARSRTGAEVSASTLRDAANKNRIVKHALGSRWAFIVDAKGVAARAKVHLFVEGHEWIAPVSLTPQIAALCDSPQVSLAECGALLSNADGLKVIEDLFALGLLKWGAEKTFIKKNPQTKRRRKR